MRLVVVLACVFALAVVLYAALSAWLARRAGDDERWHMETSTREDGTLVVNLKRAGDRHVRTVRELAPGMDALELASELRLAREEAQLQADELNRPP